MRIWACSPGAFILADGGPAILVYDNVPGGIGLSERLFERRQFWISKAAEMIAECQCQDGCPACVDPSAKKDTAEAGSAGFANRVGEMDFDSLSEKLKRMGVSLGIQPDANSRRKPEAIEQVVEGREVRQFWQPFLFPPRLPQDYRLGGQSAALTKPTWIACGRERRLAKPALRISSFGHRNHRFIRRTGTLAL